MALATSSVSGLISGMDTASIIQQLMAIERRPITLLEQNKSKAEAQKSAFSTFNTSLLALKTSADELAGESFWQSRSVSVSDSAVLSASASSATPVGNYVFSVTRLAAATQLASGGHADADTTPVGAGSFDLTVGSVTETITVGAADTLQDVADAINAKDLDLTAVVVNTGAGATPYRLVLTSTKTGLANAAAVSGTPPPGLVFSEITAARNAAVQFGTDSPISVESATNTITGLAPGLTLELKSVSAAPVTVSVKSDSAGILEKARDFLAKYNAVQGNISYLTGYDVEAEQAGVLFGNSTLRFVALDLARAMGDSVDGVGEAVNSLIMVGFALKSDGQMELDESAFSGALAGDLAGVSALFTAVVDRALSGSGASIAGPAAAAGFSLDGLINGNTDPDDFGAGDGFQSLNTIAADGGSQVFTVDFGTARQISQLAVHTLGGGQGISDFSVELQQADGTWQAAETAAGFTGSLWIRLLPETVLARAMRLTVTGTNAADGKTRLVELVAEDEAGVGLRLANQLAFVTRGTDGAIATEQTALDTRIQDIDDHIADLEERMTAKEERLRAEFTAMEMALAQMQSQSSFFLSQLGAVSSAKS